MNKTGVAAAVGVFSLASVTFLPGCEEASGRGGEPGTFSAQTFSRSDDSSGRFRAGKADWSQVQEALAEVQAFYAHTTPGQGIHRGQLLGDAEAELLREHHRHVDRIGYKIHEVLTEYFGGTASNPMTERFTGNFQIEANGGVGMHIYRNYERNRMEISLLTRFGEVPVWIGAMLSIEKLFELEKLFNLESLPMSGWPVERNRSSFYSLGKDHLGETLPKALSATTFGLGPRAIYNPGNLVRSDGRPPYTYDEMIAYTDAAERGWPGNPALFHRNLLPFGPQYRIGPNVTGIRFGAPIDDWKR